MTDETLTVLIEAAEAQQRDLVAMLERCRDSIGRLRPLFSTDTEDRFRREIESVVAAIAVAREVRDDIREAIDQAKAAQRRIDAPL